MGGQWKEADRRKSRLRSAYYIAQSALFFDRLPRGAYAKLQLGTDDADVVTGAVLGELVAVIVFVTGGVVAAAPFPVGMKEVGPHVLSVFETTTIPGPA